ncbi:hypothetical protein B0H15DRAFT_813703 [Mycena belliarum]|uniref:Uncharacterized protein n=1 Tax=Mycena belliarum TaxID=1033014 RepID=A0AAD6XVA3_9AGAR|nr:hypothetical protein B0H15DRAFT_813703 [Mycena belliae]
MNPPYYILCTIAPAPALLHPTIHYHYADDNPRALLPRPAEHVLVLDFDPDSPAPPTVQSISPPVCVTGLRVEDAPGAAAAADPNRNARMFIIDTTAAEHRPMDASMGERKPPQTVLAQYKQRNAALRRALLYPASPTKPFPGP